MKNNFTTETADFRQESKNIIGYSKLISLVKDKEQIEFINEKFNPTGEEYYIEMDNVDIAYSYVEKWTNKYEYHNLDVNNNEVFTYFLQESQDNLDTNPYDMIFNIRKEEYEYPDICATSIYDSIDQFYEEWKLSSHINYLKKNRLNRELEKINKIWLGQQRKHKKKRFLKLLKSQDNFWYLRSVSSVSFREYGTAFTFVYTILLLNCLENQGRLSIELLNLNESKISMVISYGKEKEIEGIGYIKSSIHMENNDLAYKAFKITKQVILTPKVDNANSISIQVPTKGSINDVKFSVSHKCSLIVLHNRMREINEEFLSTNEFEEEFQNILKTKSPDGLRSVIEQKIIRSKILKDCKKLRDLFSPHRQGFIDNMAKLIDLCGKAELLDIDYDLKSKLRDIISEVLVFKRK